MKKDRFGAKGADRIVDFKAGDGDRLVLGAKRFKGMDSEPGFVVAETKKEVKELSRNDVDLIYWDQKGYLYFDANDDLQGFGRKGGLFAILQSAPALAADNISLV